jgi:phosphate uptake regulator
MTSTNDVSPTTGQGVCVRTTFEQRLEGLEAKLLQMGQLVQSQLDRTLEALARSTPPWPTR